jgi:hypothetical protein
MDNEELKEEYSKIFDNIHASDELKKRVLEMKPKRGDRNSVIAAIGTAVAAVAIVVAIGGYNFSHNNGDDGGVISSVTTSESEKPTETRNKQSETVESKNDSEELTPDQNTEKPSGKSTEDYAREAVTGIPTNAPTAKTNRTESHGVSAKAKPTEAASGGKAENVEEKPKSTNNGEKSVTENTESAEDNGITGRSALTKTDAVIKMNEQAQSSSSASSAASGGASVTASVAEEYHTEQWDNDKYFSYIGFDVVNKAALAEDMKYVGDNKMQFNVDSDGVPINDAMAFVFKGDNGRRVNIVTSRDTAYTERILSDSSIVKSDICGTEAAVFATDSGYSSYMISGGTSYITRTEGITEQELTDLLISLTE